MIISIDLPLLKNLKGMFEDGDLITEDYGTISMSHSAGMKTLSSFINAAADIFFQDEVTINTQFVTESGMDIDALTFEFVKMMFGDPQRVYVLQHAKKARFDQIEAVIEQKVGPHTYDIGQNQYVVFNKKELFDYAFEVMDQGGTIVDIIRNEIDEAYFIEDYFDILDVPKMATWIKAAQRINKVKQKEQAHMSDEDIVIWAFENMPMTLKNNINGSIDKKAFAKRYLKSEEMAIRQIENYGDNFVYIGPSSLTGFKKIDFYIIDRS